VNPLFRQDRLIAGNMVRATFASWHDRVITAFMLLAALTIVRAWFLDRHWAVAAWVALAAGTMIGIGAGRLVAARLAFHAFDGLLPADALNPLMRRRYMVVWHGVGLALLSLVTLIVRPSLLVVSVPAYLAGVLIVGLSGRLGMPGRIAGAIRPGWTVREWSHSPMAGILAATSLLLSLLPARSLGTNALVAVAGFEALLLALMLTGVDNATVRFMTIAGHPSRSIISHHAKGVATFLAVSVPGCWIILGPVAVGIVASVCAAILLLLTLRVLTYRLYAKRLADFLVSFLAGLLMLVAFSMPVVLPLIAIVLFGQLQRRGRAKTWLLA